MRVGPYQLVSLLGQGGTGQVWEARHVSTGARVALKRLTVGSGDAKRVASAVDEARVLSTLHHPNVVALLDSGNDQEVPWLALELVEGMSAAALLTSGARMSEPVAAYVACGLARALEAAHSARGAQGQLLGLVHRDVTPGNVLLGFDGSVKLGDFGIAWAKERMQQTTVGIVKGTPAWMAPEQSTAGSIDARADIFSLGCVLHALISGENPLAGENRLVDLLAGVALPLSPMLSAPLSAVLSRALSRDRSARFASAGELAEALAPLAATDGAAQLRVQLLEIPRRSPEGAAASPRRWPWAVLAAAAIAAGVFAARGPLSAAIATPAPTQAPIVAAVAPPPIAAVAVPDPAPVAAPPADPRPTTPDAARLPAHVVNGVLAIGGEAAVRGEVFIDGRSMGFAPLQLELPVGAHQLAVTLAGGGHFGPRTVKIRSTDTHAAPQRVVVSEP